MRRHFFVSRSLMPSEFKNRSPIVMKVLPLLIFLVIDESIGARSRRMVGGYSIPIDKVPYQVSIRYNDYHICGGTLISSRHVLTAAHCVADLFEEPYDEISVVTGTASLSSGGNENKVKSIIWHDKFVNELDSTWNNDIAVMTLVREVEKNERQKPIKLPDEEPRINGTGLMSGFGRTSSENPYLSNNLQAAKTRILPGGACQQFINNHTVRATQICGLQEKGIGVCRGDSGGPLVHDGKIVGISSWNIPCARGIPDVYTNVYKYLDFIKYAMKLSCSSCTIL